ncbi:nuclear envelope pore membrane protein POM 121-like [Anolis sagrei]|uniref:nuclear envelope pore membrane protein POM 121-like n=1 Tax=Anolis sagrei TaxID=38937 RepID=UPI003521351D
MVVQALQEKERPEKRKAEGTDLELNHYGREKRSRYESAESGSSQVPASGGAPASIVPQPGTLDTLPGHKRAFKRKHCSSPLSTSSTESISYGIPQIFKAKGGKKTLKSTHGQDNLSKEPSCSQSSHLENGPHRTMQVKMDVVETPRQEASNLQAPALCPDSPKWMSVSFVRINPNEPSKLTPELEALSEAMKVRAEAEKAARLQQEDHSVCTEQTSQGGAPPSPQPGPSWPAGPDSMPVIFGSGVPFSHEELLPPVTEMEVDGPSSSSVAAPQLPSPSAAPSSGGGGFVAKTPIKYSRSVLRPATLAAPTPSNRQAQLTPSSGPLQTSAGPTQGPVELGSPFGFPASGSSTSGALQAAYSLPRPSGSFHF